MRRRHTTPKQQRMGFKLLVCFGLDALKRKSFHRTGGLFPNRLEAEAYFRRHCSGRDAEYRIEGIRVSANPLLPKEGDSHANAQP